MAKSLTPWVLCAIALGACVGLLAPDFAVQLKFISDIFIRLVKMVIAPIVFLSIATGIANMGDLKKVGVIGAKALIYFEVVTTFALALGLLVAALIKPGAGVDTSRLQAVAPVPATPMHMPAARGFREFVVNIVPDSVVGALAQGDMLPVLLFAVLCGAVLARQGREAAPLVATLGRLAKLFFGVVDLVMWLSPFAAFAAMAYTVGQFGLYSLWALGKLMLAVYITMALFVVLVLGAIARVSRFSLWKLLRHLRSEIVLVLGTASSESVLPTLMAKLESAGCSKAVVGLVVPTGYSFNLDGTAIYLSMATLFIAQAYGVSLTVPQLALTFGVLMLTSKGAAGVTGSGFVTLAATLATLPHHAVPPEGIALVVGVDRFMSEARALTNLIGNSVATVALSKAEGEFSSRGIF